jgi:hypothetical protein
MMLYVQHFKTGTNCALTNMWQNFKIIIQEIVTEISV